MNLFPINFYIYARNNIIILNFCNLDAEELENPWVDLCAKPGSWPQLECMP